jgi:hypothetical protein
VPGIQARDNAPAAVKKLLLSKTPNNLTAPTDRVPACDQSRLATAIHMRAKSLLVVSFLAFLSSYSNWVKLAISVEPYVPPLAAASDEAQKQYASFAMPEGY